MRYTVSLLLGLFSHVALGMELKICVDSNEWAPYTYPNRDGSLQILVKMAASRLGHQVRIVALPWRRCQTEVEAGNQDGMLAVAATDYSLSRFVFPRRGSELDTSRAVVAAPFVLVRLVGGTESWDGQQLSKLQGPVLYPHGYADIAARLKQLHIPGEAGALTNEQNARKMLAGRAKLMAIYQGDALKLVQQPDFAGLLEILPEPFGESLSYLAVGKPFYARNPSEAEQLWTELGTVKLSEGYRRAISQRVD